MQKKLLKNKVSCSILTIISCIGAMQTTEASTLSTQWNDLALQAIRTTHPGPPVVARALAITHTCMYDAWAAYNNKAIGTRYGKKLKRPAAENTMPNKEKAISYAAYQCLKDLFPTEQASFDNFMLGLGFKPNDNLNPNMPDGIGNLVAKAVLEFRHHDGSNQLGDLHPGPYTDYTGYKPINTSTVINDPNHWQALDVNGNVQVFIAPHWGNVIPFALKTGSQFRKITPNPANFFTEPERYKTQAKQILEYSANLTDEKKVIAEYWADGPSSELPPGHWTLFGEFVSNRDHHTLDQDIKMFFSLTNAIFDASIASWEAKRFYDYVRPVTAINLLYAGQTVESWQGSIDGSEWRPYQAANVVTPPFPEYYSGHSIFSAAGAEILKLFTGSDYFGNSVTIETGSSKVEPGIVPKTDVTLYWASFTDAADEAGISRRYGGIHFIDGDLISRKIGRLIAQQAWGKSLSYFAEVKHHKDKD